jgi:Cd(II)/Pb(II)-responsive transcriptional regulator
MAMKIGELAVASATQTETIRYYEREGLLPPPARTEGNFRDYEKVHLDRLLFIRHCRSLDMSLNEVRTLLQAKDDPGADCGDVNALLDEHIGHVAKRVKELRRLEKQLKQLRAQCGEARASGQCGILSGISHASHEPAAARPASHLPATHGR